MIGTRQLAAFLLAFALGAALPVAALAEPPMIGGGPPTVTSEGR